MLPKINKIILFEGVYNEISNRIITSVTYSITGLKPVLIESKSTTSGSKDKNIRLLDSSYITVEETI